MGNAGLVVAIVSQHVLKGHYMDLIPVIARILLRYLSGALVAYGVIPHEAGAELAMDPDLALVVGAAMGAAVEAFYAVVKAKGGKT